MVSKVMAAGLRGIQGVPVLCECDLANGLPAFEIVGLPDASVKEARDRVRSAVKNCGFDFPLRRITVNLAPADLKKEGPVYDLPILLGILWASGQIPAVSPRKAFLGELSLDGALRPVTGVLPMALALGEEGVDTLFVPRENGAEASVAAGVKVIPVSHVKELVDHLRGEAKLQPLPPYDYAGRRDVETTGFMPALGPGKRQAGAGGGRRRFPSCAAHRPAGGWQEHAGPASALHPSRSFL